MRTHMSQEHQGDFPLRDLQPPSRLIMLGPSAIGNMPPPCSIVYSKISTSPITSIALTSTQAMNGLRQTRFWMKLHSLDLETMLSRWMHDKNERARFKRLMLYDSQSRKLHCWAWDFENGEPEAVTAFALLLSMLVHLTSISLRDLLAYHVGPIDELLQATKP